MVKIRFSDSITANLFRGALEAQFPTLIVQSYPKTLTNVPVDVCFNASSNDDPSISVYPIAKKLAANYSGKFISEEN